MKTASRISSKRSCQSRDSERVRELYDFLAPPKTRKRMREARRWLDELWVRSSNGRMHERRPRVRLLTGPEMRQIFEAGFAELEVLDPELYESVHAVLARNLLFEDCETTLEQWKRRAVRRMRRISRIRAEMMRAGAI